MVNSLLNIRVLHNKLLLDNFEVTELLLEANDLFLDFVDASLRLEELSILVALILSFLLNNGVKVLDLLHLLANSVLTALHLGIEVSSLLLLYLHFVHDLLNLTTFTVVLGSDLLVLRLVLVASEEKLLTDDLLLLHLGFVLRDLLHSEVELRSLADVLLRKLVVLLLFVREDVFLVVNLSLQRLDDIGISFIPSLEVHGELGEGSFFSLEVGF